MIEQSPSSKIVHGVEEDEDGCFEHAAEEQQDQPHVPTLAEMGMLGEANPIYSGIAQPQPEQARVGLSLKVIPQMRDDLIETYKSFSIGGDHSASNRDGGFEQTVSKQQIDEKKRAEQLQKQLQNNVMFTSKQSPFLDLYEPEQLVYQKIDNSRFNKFREILYFTGLFIPKDNLIDSFKEKQTEGNIGEEKGLNLTSNKKYYGICELMAKQLNKISSKVKNKSYRKTYKAEPFVVNTSEKDTVIFDSNFESGNLFAAFRTGKYSYELLASNDTNSRGTKQWFYFSMTNLQPNINYRITIINFNKRDSLFNHGLMPVVYSMKENQGLEPHLWDGNSGGPGWIRFGKDVCYYKGEILRENSTNKYYSALTFVINWKQTGDKIYLAHSYPYGYDRLVKLLDNLYLKNYAEKGEKGGGKKSRLDNEQSNANLNRNQQQGKNASRNQVKVPLFSEHNSLKIKKLGKTIGRNWIYAIQLKHKEINTEKKEAIIIMARQHPGETQGSFVCEGVIKKLIDEHTSKESTYLLKNFHIYIIPMVNPDGVVHGHYRTNLCGKDLNRKWEDPETVSSATPEITIISKFINDLTTKNKLNVRFILDLHGHSKKLNSFFYGNPFPEKPQTVKMYPYICSRLNQAVQYMDCTFSTEQYKKKAARIYLSSALKQINVYTFQSSFYGYNPRQNPNKVRQFTPVVYENLGKTLIDSLYVFLFNNSNKNEDQKDLSTANKEEVKEGENPEKEENSSPLDQFTKNLYKEMKKQLIQNQRLLGVGDLDSSGSESNPEEGQLNIEEIKIEIDQDQKQKAKEEESGTDERVIGMGIKNLEKKEGSYKTTKMKGHPSRKSANQIIEYKEFSRPVRNVKYLALSQVNAVLPDKYHISLQPMEAMAYRIGKKYDAETQTETMEKVLFKLYKAIQIEEKNTLFGIGNNKQKIPKEEEGADDRYNKRSQQIQKNSAMTAMFNNHTPVVGNSNPKPFHSKKHSEIIANIQKSKIKKQEELTLKFDLEDDNVRKRKGNRGNKQKFRTVFTQTMVSIKIVQTNRTSQLKAPQKVVNQITMHCPHNNYVLNPIPSRWGTLEPLQSSHQSLHQPASPRTKLITENESRISQMQKINKEVLKVYSRKSAMVEMNLSTKKSQNKSSNKQNIFARKI